MRLAARAAATLRIVDSHLPATCEALARLLLRHEGIASSGIEGLHEPIESVLVAERVGAGGAAGWVADNLAVIGAATETAHETLTVGMLHEWHERLMRNGHLPPEMVGAFRPLPGWVGGSSPLDAAYVPPLPDEIPRLVDDLLVFADATDDEFDGVSRAALIHAQFEAIHPYGDGNGRLGRVLVCRALRRAGLTQRATVPLSMAIARDTGGYLSGLHLFEQGHVGPWIRWFAEIAERAALMTRGIIDRTNSLIAQWSAAAADLRSDSAARALLPLLTGHPVLSAPDVARLLNVSERAGRTALHSLADRRVLRPAQVTTKTTGRDRHWFVAPDLLDLWSP